MAPSAAASAGAPPASGRDGRGRGGVAMFPAIVVAVAAATVGVAYVRPDAMAAVVAQLVGAAGARTGAWYPGAAHRVPEVQVPPGKSLVRAVEGLPEHLQRRPVLLRGLPAQTQWTAAHAWTAESVAAALPALDKVQVVMGSGDASTGTADSASTSGTALFPFMYGDGNGAWRGGDARDLEPRGVKRTLPPQRLDGVPVACVLWPPRSPGVAGSNHSDACAAAVASSSLPPTARTFVTNAAAAYKSINLRMPQLAGLLPDVQPLDSMTPGFANQNAYLWLGSAGATATPHYDVDDNAFVQIVGRKRFVLWPPSTAEAFHVYPSLHDSARQAQVSNPAAVASAAKDQGAGVALSGSDATLLPDFELPPAMEVVLEPGDVLFLPAYWLHWVTALEASVSVNVWAEADHAAAVRAAEDARVPVSDDMSLAATVVIIRSHVQSVLNALFSKGTSSASSASSAGGGTGDGSVAATAAGAFLEDLLYARYFRLLREDPGPPSDAGGSAAAAAANDTAATQHAAASAAAESGGDKSGTTASDAARRRGAVRRRIAAFFPASGWLNVLASDEADETRQLIAPSAQAGGEDTEEGDLAGAAQGTELLAAVRGSARRVVAALATLPSSVRRIVAMDHVEQLASFVLELPATAAYFAQARSEDGVSDASADVAAPGPVDVAVFIRDALLADWGAHAAAHAASQKPRNPFVRSPSFAVPASAE